MARIDAPHVRTREGRVHLFDANALPWHETARAGLRLKPVCNDDERGEFLGLVAFDPFVASGLHQHRGVATSFVLDGGLTDYHGSLKRHQVGINVRGSTHDAIAYQPTVLVSRLEGPVLYPPGDDAPSGVHAGSQLADFVNPDPDIPPEVNVDPDVQPSMPSGIVGLARQSIFDYAGTGTNRRLLQWQLRPGTELPRWRASGPVDLWVRGGELRVDGRSARANTFVLIEPGATPAIAAPFGALVLVWAEGPEAWPSAPRGADLFGFGGG